MLYDEVSGQQWILRRKPYIFKLILGIHLRWLHITNTSAAAIGFVLVMVKLSKLNSAFKKGGSSSTAGPFPQTETGN